MSASCFELNSMGFGHPEFSSEFEFEFEFEFFAFRLGVTKLKLKTHKTHKTHESFGLSLSLSFQVSLAPAAQVICSLIRMRSRTSSPIVCWTTSPMLWPAPPAPPAAPGIAPTATGQAAGGPGQKTQAKTQNSQNSRNSREFWLEFEF